MYKFSKRSIVMGMLALIALTLGACSGEIPPELLEAAAVVESSGIEQLEIDLSDLAEELEFIGSVQAISASEWTVADLNFLVKPSTEIKGSPQVGDRVKVHASLTAEGALLAREIELAAMDDGSSDDDGDDAFPFNLENEFEFVGIVDALGAAEWMIAGRSIVILPQTEVKGVILEGDLVKVHAFMNETGDLAAREIEPALEDDLDDDDMDDDDDLKLVGFVEQIGDETWVVAGIEFSVGEGTEIEGDIQVGDLVEVYFFTSEDGEQIAREIELEDEMDDDDLDDDDDDDDLDDDDDDDDDDEYDDDDDDDSEEDEKDDD